MKNLVLELKQLQKRFRKRDALFHDLSIQIERGEFVAIIGPNGSGKTTLVRMIMGLEKPTSGEVHLYEEKIGYVPQRIDRDIYSVMTVRELLLLKLDNSSFWFARKKHEKDILDALRLTNTQKLIDSQMKHLSGGEFQRVMIAYALANNPGVLILDEPISGVDVHGEQDFFQLIEKIHKEKGITVLMISHDIDIVYQYATQVLCLNRELVCHGVPAEVLNKETIEKTFTTKHGVYHHQHQAKHKHE